MAAILSSALSHPLEAVGVLLLAVVSYHVVPYFLDPYGLRKYPGPTLAAFSDFYLASLARSGKRYAAVNELHEKYGPYVRIAPNHLSIADPDALNPIYGHGTGTTKSNFYDAFVSIERGLFNTRDRQQHTRKRKIVSHTFSPASVKDFEPYVAEVVAAFLKKWDDKCAAAKKAGSNGGWWLCDCLFWLNALAFDVIGSLAFGEPFGMVEREADIVVVEHEDGTTEHLPAVQILNERGEYSATQGVLPVWIRPYTKYIDPWFARGQTSVKNLAGIARNRVNKRLASGQTERKDLLSYLQKGRDEQGQPMAKPELTAEALTQLIAGSDTTSNSSCAILFFLAKHPQVQDKLVKAISEHFGEEEGVLDYEQIQKVKYLDYCIKEALRRHSTSSIGLPRILAQPTDFKGEHLRPGAIASVPSYSIHHSKTIWGDPYAYRPERWEGPKGDELEKKYFVPFGHGPRSCVGRNIAYLELQVFIGSIINRYEIKLKDESLDELPSSEGFLRKPTESWIYVKKRKETAL